MPEQTAVEPQYKELCAHEDFSLPKEVGADDLGYRERMAIHADKLGLNLSSSKRISVG